MGLLLHPADDHPCLAKVRLRVSRRMGQRHEQLPAPAPAPVLTHVVLHDRVAPDESVLGAQPIEHPLGSVALLARLRAVLLQPPLDELGEPVELRATDPHRAPIPWRHGKLQHLLHALARDPEVLRRRTLAHPLPARQAYLAIQLHGVNPSALPVAGKGHSGRVLLRRGGTIPPPPWSSFTPPFASDCRSLTISA